MRRVVPGWRRRRVRGLCSLPALVLCLGLGLSSCGEDVPDVALEAEASAQQQLLDGEPSAALATCRKALAGGAESPGLRLAAATACLDLKRLSDALSHARVGLNDRRTSGPIRADLSWAEGKAALLRYRELSDETDWRRANSSLETASEAGEHRLEAATLLVIMQHTHPRGDAARKARFAALVRELAPDSKEAATVARLMQSEDAGG
ncbi:MAG: hypothetical protein DRQ55_01830 [Planctomycetota bacterium]|nr:MAG: hypothetical protein DRQ55_01830 [Planctomycetota bacterium]